MDNLQSPTLRRTIGPWQMAFYAIGSMLGAGIYGLIGQAVATSGNAIWLSFLVALVGALLTGLSYASLGSRYPRAGGTAYIVERAFNSPMMGYGVGMMLAFSAMIGIPTMAQVFARNFADILHLSDAMIPVVTVAFLALMAGIIFRGIQESMWVNILCSVVEATGLLVVIAVGMKYWGSVDYMEVPATSASIFPALNLTVVAVMSSTVLTFFAFIGFEDTLNVAEETHNPQRTLPMGLLIAMAVVAVLYIAVAITAVSVVPWQELSLSRSPLTEVIRRAAPIIPPALFGIIALFAVTNTLLVNFVTASRLLYGMSQQGLLPKYLGRVHGKNRTPHMAIFTLFVLFMPFAIYGTIAQLAATSTLLLLTVFAIMNISLVVLQRRLHEEGEFEIHQLIPVLGSIVCVILIVSRIITGEWTAPAIAGGAITGIFAVYRLTRAK